MVLLLGMGGGGAGADCGGDVGTGSVRFGGSGRSSGAVSVVGLMVDVRWLRFDYGDFPTERIFHPFLH
ncbi:unnamed protein product [Prunus armeniaca]|uniref:Uncharacterized protein n=1 Tax=Prunus armeniaca TaxID=36596 RepID=A0A6J5U2V9_PRUAR|nr:unnamed protein product [Prunus armeniaca]